MKDGLIISILSLVPKKPIARIMGKSARIKLPRFLHKLLIRWFVWKYGVNLNETIGNIEDFSSLADFFLRPLKKDVRPVEQDPQIWISPVDATVHTFGAIESGCFKQSTSQMGNVAELVGSHLFSDGLDEAPYQNGSFVILYLSPKDYHRVHTPNACQVSSIRYLPGALWPVFPAATRKIKGLFNKNERLVFQLQSSIGEAILVMVGAFGVGRMSTGLNEILTNENETPVELPLTPPPSLARAEELGRFELGSTVVLLWPHQDLDFLISTGMPIKLGMPLARKTN